MLYAGISVEGKTPLIVNENIMFIFHSSTHQVYCIAGEQQSRRGSSTQTPPGRDTSDLSRLAGVRTTAHWIRAECPRASDAEWNITSLAFTATRMDLEQTLHHLGSVRVMMRLYRSAVHWQLQPPGQVQTLQHISSAILHYNKELSGPSVPQMSGCILPRRWLTLSHQEAYTNNILI